MCDAIVVKDSIRKIRHYTKFSTTYFIDNQTYVSTISQTFVYLLDLTLIHVARKHRDSYTMQSPR